MSVTETYQSLLARLAEKKGLELEYRDIWGQGHSVSTETQSKILSAMGCQVESPEALKEGLQKETGKEWKQLVDDLLIVSENQSPHELIFQFPVKGGSDKARLPDDIRVQLKIAEESGKTTTFDMAADQLQFKEAVSIEKDWVVRGSLVVPPGLSLGYHDGLLTLHSDGLRLEQPFKLIVCPERAYLPPVLRGKGRRAGLMIALAGLRSRHNWGIGDFHDLKELVRWAVPALQVDVIGLLPLHALSNREPYNISPYYPSSRMYRNPIYLSLQDIEEYHYSLKAWKRIMEPVSQELLRDLRGSETVQFEKADRLKTEILIILFETFLERHWKPAGEETERQKAFLRYVRQEGELLETYALFCALEAHFKKNFPDRPTWRQWPAPYQNPDSPEVRAFHREHQQEILFYKYLQWQIEEQLTEVQDLARTLGAGIGLYHDLALGSDPGGADCWAWRDYTVPGMRVGCPPDDFAPLGQEWGFCPPNNEAYRRGGYQFFAREIAKNCRPGGALRIDHVLKLCRLFWIPEGRTPKEGAYVNYPLEELLQVLTLESVRHKTLIIGEDLGTLPDGLREILQDKGLFSYRLFYFEKNQEGNLNAPQAYPESALASVSTHDLPPLAGFWAMDDLFLRKDLGLFAQEDQFPQAITGRILEKRRIVDRLQELGFLSEEEGLALQAQEEPALTGGLVRAVLSFLVSTEAKLTVLSQEDLFNERHQFNLPGTTNQYPNWSRKMRFSLEDLHDHPEARRQADQFRELIGQSGRGVKKSL
jgi:4-alpha-glucanotransferase